MEKLLEMGAWGRLTLTVAPGLLVVLGIAPLLNLQRFASGDSAALWKAGVSFVTLVVCASVFIEEVRGWFEAKVDSRLYPGLRAFTKRVQRMRPVFRVDPSRYSNSLSWVWERYLDLIPPASRANRWVYYDALVQRYLVMISFCVGIYVVGVVWVIGAALGLFPIVAGGPLFSSLVTAGIGVASLLFAMYLTLVSIPSMAWLIHWQRCRLVRLELGLRASRSSSQTVRRRRGGRDVV